MIYTQFDTQDSLIVLLLVRLLHLLLLHLLYRSTEWKRLDN